MSPAWVPFELTWDDAPLDLSFLYADERPAGRHGFLTAARDRFMFENGSPARFWGTNFTGGANFPERDESERIAHRLAKFGVNLVRAHSLDADSPNIFQFNPAEPLLSTRMLDDRSLDRFDYLLACLKEQGVYVYLDLLVYRRFLPGDGVRNARELIGGARPYCCFDRRLIELQKEFNEQLWTHLNPYTGLEYRDDPVIVLTELVNENSFYIFPPTIEPYRGELTTLYQDWARREGLTAEAEPVFEKPNEQIAEFFVHLERKYYQELTSHLRELGVRIPITGTTGTGGSILPQWGTNLALLESQSETDFTDAHLYWNHPLWWEEPPESDPPAAAKHRPMVEDARPTYAHALSFRTQTRPFLVSEWGQHWPDEWRAESPIAHAAIGSFQDWGGLAIYTYRHSTDGPVGRIGGGTSTTPEWSASFHRNHFATFNDPAQFGLFYNAALLFRRGDVQTGREEAVVQVDNEEGWRLFRSEDLPALDSLGELHRASIALPGRAVQANHVLSRQTALQAAEAKELIADTGEFGRNRSDGIGWIDTARSKAIYGFIGRRLRIALEGFEVVPGTDFATLALSSLTDEPIQDSPVLLLTAVGRSDNSGTAYNEQRTRLLRHGHAPVLIDAVRAELVIRARPELGVWVIGARGELVTRLSSEYIDGRLKFQIGPRPQQEQSTIYYLIRA